MSNKNNFQERVKEYLEHYKRTVLSISEVGEYRAIAKEHILTVSIKNENIFEKYRDYFSKDYKDNIDIKKHIFE